MLEHQCTRVNLVKKKSRLLKKQTNKQAMYCSLYLHVMANLTTLNITLTCPLSHEYLFIIRKSNEALLVKISSYLHFLTWSHNASLYVRQRFTTSVLLVWVFSATRAARTCAQPWLSWNIRMRGNLDKQKYISRSEHFIREHPAGPFSEHIHVLQPSREIYQSPGSCCLPRQSKQRSTGTTPVLKLLIKSVSNDQLKKALVI